MGPKEPRLPSGDYVRALRRTLGVPLHRLATYADVGTTTLANYEKGSAHLSRHTAAALAKAVQRMQRLLATRDPEALARLDSEVPA